MSSKQTAKRKVKYSNTSHIESFDIVNDAKDHVFQAILRNAYVRVWLADTGRWCVAVTEVSDNA